MGYDNLRKKHKGENDLVMSAHFAPSEAPSLIPSTHIGECMMPVTAAPGIQHLFWPPGNMTDSTNTCMEIKEKSIFKKEKSQIILFGF